jgi:hypothetical protein
MLVRLDAALRARSFVAWCVFRGVCGFLVAVGLFAWCGVWFQRHPWAGAAMAFNCTLVLAHELGLIGQARR